MKASVKEVITAEEGQPRQSPKASTEEIQWDTVEPVEADQGEESVKSRGKVQKVRVWVM